jgi:putative ABC transport system ATP-binding protein
LSEPFILCDGLVKIYKIAGLEQVALRELNITIEKGELMSIIGASGSGKTTLMNILGGLDRPSAGRVRVDGHDLLRMTDSQLNKYRREKVGFVWQQSTRNLISYLNAVENVMLPMTVAGLAHNRRRRADELLDLVGLDQRKHHQLSELSGGEQQRVAIAVALANHPPLLLADEPTGEVDTVTAQMIYDTFRHLTREMGITTIIVSHDPGISKQVDRVVAIRDGMLASETVRQVRANGANGNGAAGQIEGGHNGIVGASALHDTFEELVVLDRAGRVHVPQEYLEQYQIKGRARLELVDGGILIRAVDQRPAAEPAVQRTDGDQETGVSADATEEDAGQQNSKRGWFGNFGRRNKKQ